MSTIRGRDRGGATRGWPAAQPSPSIPCPECGTLVVLTLEDLLRGESFTCPGCGLVPSRDKAATAQALGAAKKMRRGGKATPRATAKRRRR